MRVLAGFREPNDPGLRLVRGEGAWVWDSRGRRLLDLASQNWNINLGHGNPRVRDAAASALHNGVFTSTRFGVSHHAELFAQRLHAILGPGYGSVHFATCGTMAVEAAAKIARWVTGRTGILSFHRSFHGVSLLASSAGGYDHLLDANLGRARGHAHVEPFHCLRCPWGLRRTECAIDCATAVEDYLGLHGRMTAALLAEPLISNQVLVPPDDFWPRVARACRKHGVLLIADEIVHGLGRCGDWLGMTRAGVGPDIALLGKGLTNGEVPLAAVVLSRDLTEHFASRPFLHGQTFEAHHVACSAACAVLDETRDRGLLGRVRGIEHHFAESLANAASSSLPGAELRGWGAYWGLELPEALVPAERTIQFAQALHHRAIEEGVLLGGTGRVVILAPPFVVGNSDLDWGFNRVIRSIEATASQLRR